MASGHANHHDYHLVAPSPWPAIGSIAAFVLALGAILFFRGFGPWIMILGMAGLAYTMAGWWRDVVLEARHGDHTPVVQIHLRYGMILFIISEILFFAAWFWAYFNASLFPADPAQAMRTELFAGVWPPQGIKVFNPWDIPFLNTLVLLTSGTTITWAHHALLEGDREGLRRGLALTIVLGILFTALQVYEYTHAAFGFSGHIYGATFFMATGFHGLHVIIGTLFLIVCFFRVRAGDFTPQQHFGFEAAAWYWHFVDVVWLFLFACIYIWGAGAAA